MGPAAPGQTPPPPKKKKLSGQKTKGARPQYCGRAPVVKSLPVPERKSFPFSGGRIYLFLLYSSEHTSDSFTPFSASITIM